ncbi:unnamed protein product, partial [Ectocarpus sp. 12 AP-2014]
MFSSETPLVWRTYAPAYLVACAATRRKEGGIMSRMESLAPATISPEGSHPDSEHLSNWGSVEDDPAVATTSTSASRHQHQQRRQPAASSNTSRRTSTPSSSTVRSDARRGYAGSNARLAGGKAGAGPAGRLSLMANGRSQTSATKQTAAPSSGRGSRAGPVDRPTASSSQERLSVGAGTRRSARKRLSVERNGAAKPRSSSIGSVGRRTSLGGRRAEEDPEEEEEEEDALRGIGDLDAVAPSQEEIRVMIDRIRRESAMEEVVGAGGRTVNSKGQRFEHEAAPASGSSITSKLLRSARVVGRQQQQQQQQQPVSSPAPAVSSGSLVSSTAAVSAPASQHRRGSASNSEVAATTAETAGAEGGGTEAGAGVGVVGMGEIEEEERRLQEKASKLELEMSAVQSR